MRRLIVLLAGLALVAGLHAVTGISGTVVNADNGLPISGATVCCYVTNTQTDSNGCYLLADLAPGKYRVRAIATGFQTGYYPESVLVVCGRVTPDINFALVPNGHPNGGISGRVTNAQGGGPICGALITAHGPHGSGCDTSQPCGGYIINSLPAGKYQVCAQASGFVPHIYPESVTVVGGQTTPNINFALVPSGGTGAVSGMVYNAQSRQPIFGALVRASGPSQGHANTHENGMYCIADLLPGTYLVMASACGFYPSDWDTVDVASGETTKYVCFGLEPMSGGVGAISGVVKDSATLQGIPLAHIFAWGPAGQGSTDADSNGNYVVQDLEPGAYVVRACASGYHPGYYPDSVHVLDGQTTPDINFLLSPVHPLDAGIGGFVFDGMTQTEIPGAHVIVTGPSGSHDAYSDSRGDYLVTGLAAGEYALQAEAPGYQPGSYPEPVTVVSGEITAFISPALFVPTGVKESPATRPVADRFDIAPNPFSGQTQICWQLPKPGPSIVRIYDNLGRLVRTLADVCLTPGPCAVTWNGRDNLGRVLPNGAYFCELRTTSGSFSEMVVLLK